MKRKVKVILMSHHTLSPFPHQVVAALHDRMTECRYLKPLTSFLLDKKPEPWYEVDIVGKGKAALENVNEHLGKIKKGFVCRGEAELQFYF